MVAHSRTCNGEGWIRYSVRLCLIWIVDTIELMRNVR